MNSAAGAKASRGFMFFSCSHVCLIVGSATPLHPTPAPTVAATFSHSPPQVQPLRRPRHARPTHPTMASQALASLMRMPSTFWVILTGIDPPTGAAGMSVRLQGGHFPPAPVMVRFENQANHAVQTAMSIPSDRPRGTVVTVPSGLPAGTYNVGIMQAGLPDPVSQTVQFTVP